MSDNELIKAITEGIREALIPSAFQGDSYNTARLLHAELNEQLGGGHGALLDELIKMAINA